MSGDLCENNSYEVLKRTAEDRKHEKKSAKKTDVEQTTEEVQLVCTVCSLQLINCNKIWWKWFKASVNLQVFWCFVKLSYEHTTVLFIQ